MQEPSTRTHTSYQKAEKQNDCKAMHAQSLINGDIQIHSRTATLSHSRSADSLAMSSGAQSRIYIHTQMCYIHRCVCNVKEVLTPLHLLILPVHAGWLEGAAACAASPVAVHLSQHSAGDPPPPEPVHMVQPCNSVDMSGKDHIQCSRQQGTIHCDNKSNLPPGSRAQEPELCDGLVLGFLKLLQTCD